MVKFFKQKLDHPFYDLNSNIINTRVKITKDKIIFFTSYEVTIQLIPPTKERKKVETNTHLKK